MDCARWIEPMSARLDGESEPDEVAALDAHLDQCAGCRSRFDALERQHRRARLQEAPVVPDLVPAVLRAVGALDRPSDRRRPTGRWWTPVAGAVGLAVASVSVGLVIVHTADAQPAPDPVVAAALVRPAVQGAAAAVTLSLDNPGGADTVVAASSPAATSVAFHRSSGHVGEAVMRAVTTVPVPARSSDSFGAADTHLMLQGLRQDLRPGDQVVIRLEFARSGAMDVTATVEA